MSIRGRVYWQDPRSSPAGLRKEEDYAGRPLSERTENVNLLVWALVFLVLAVLAAILGFGVVAATSALIARVLFFVFVVVFIILLIAGLLNRPR